jgi:nucleotide-binding universal stress UspA family protein
VKKEARRVLDEEAKNIENVGGTVAESHFRMGAAAQEIVNLVEELKVDLIAVGSRGRSRTKRALMGSVSDSVVRHAHCPVLVVRNEHRHTQLLSGEASSGAGRERSGL